MAQLQTTNLPATQAFKVQSGNTAGRPSAIAGTLYFNTDSGFLEVYNGSSWVQAKSTETKGGTVVEFSTPTSSTFTVPAGITSISVLVLAGGGAGGAGTAGGGGAGGLIYVEKYPVQGGTSYPVVVGQGGAQPGLNGGKGNNGQNSSFNDLVAIGGGGGGTGGPGNSPANPGGCGGGGTWYPSNQTTGGTGTQPSQPGWSGIYGFGYPGNPTGGNCGGGGGVGGVGGAFYQNGNNGGVGRYDSITGTPVIRGGGGNGQANTPGGGAPGRNPWGGGGGPNGSGSYPGGWAQGAGGGGGWDYGSGSGAAGGPGVVIIKY